MDFGILLKRAGKVAADNSPAILTAIGVTGTLATAYLAAVGGFKSVDALKKAEEEKRENHFTDVSDPETGEPVEAEFEGLTFQEKVEATWKYYAPAGVMVVATVTSIICAAKVNERRKAALASAYSIVEKSYSEYRAKTLEKAGKNKEQAIRDEIAQERVEKNPITRATIIMTDRGGDTLCHDPWSGRWFNSDMESLRKAVNDFNAVVINQSYAPLSDFYSLLRLDPTMESDTVGWSTDKLLEVDYHGIIHDDGTPGISIEFKTLPDSRFGSLYG